MMTKIANVALVALTLAAGGRAEESRSLGSRSSRSSGVKSMYFSELLANDETVELLSHGPFTITAGCGTIEGNARARLFMTVTADSDEDEWVYGHPDWMPVDNNSCVGTTTKGTISDTCIAWETESGAGNHPGAYSSLSGYYVAFGASSTIGFNKESLTNDFTYHDGFTAEDIAAFPTDCAISGEITYNK